MKMDVIQLSDLIDNATGAAFESRGVSRVKATKGGKPIILEVPIRSRGVAEFQDKLSVSAPVPPSKLEKIDGKPQRVPDLSDAGYIKEYDKYWQDLVWKVVAYAIDLEQWRDASIEEKIQRLKDNGLTGHQLDQIYDDLQELTKFTEGELDFLSDG